MYSDDRYVVYLPRSGVETEAAVMEGQLEGWMDGSELPRTVAHCVILRTLQFHSENKDGILLDI